MICNIWFFKKTFKWAPCEAGGSGREELKKQHTMQITHNPKWPYIPDHSYRILIIGGSGSGQTNALLNSLNRKPDINKIQLYAKDQYKAKYNFFNQKT